MSKTVTFTLDGQQITTAADKTLWEITAEQGTRLPHLCHADQTGYRADGNCRACMVEIEGERVLAASCIRTPTEGMVVNTQSSRAVDSRKLVMELLLADQPERSEAHDRSSHLWKMADLQGVTVSRFPAIETSRVPLLDASHVAMKVNLDACIHCNLCVRACREVQVNDVIGMSGRGRNASITFDFSDRGDSDSFDREVESVCPYCGVGCQLSFKIKDEKIAWVDGIEGPANEQRLCVKGRFGFDYIAEALAAAAGGMKTLKEQHGGEAVAGFGSAKCSNEEAYLFQKFIRTGFEHNNVDHCTRLCHASSVAALMENVGSGAVTATFNEIENADCAIVIGANPVENHPVAATYFKQFAKRGGTLIVMDPRSMGLARHATHNLKFTPGSDVAMLNAIMHVIVEEELYDQNYINQFTEGWEAIKAHVKDFPPEAMASACGIDAEVLRTVARTFANADAAMIFWGMGVSQHVHGTDNSRCLISLALMCGHVGRSGSGLHPLRGQNNVQGASDAGLIPMFLPDYQNVEDDGVRSLFADIWGTNAFFNKRGLTVVEIMDAIHDSKIRSLYVLGENPAMSDPNVEHARDALAKLEHLVVQDIFLTETANYAKPACQALGTGLELHPSQRRFQ